ncbi:MAG TPA: hypothetical protein VN688_29235 [Gemmataceae bacterium]|nr:hypothetical protein [Gemmataceae bacterium]
MPIPAFDDILNILPPHLGDPRQRADLSPFSCTVAELCTRFATTAKRKAILDGFLNLRAELFTLDIRGFQWLGGSFLEDIEAQERRDPGDIDAVTFVADPENPAALSAKLVTKPELLSHAHIKGTYSVDHYWLSLGSQPVFLVDLTRYWYGLFSHRRDRVWKGMLVVELADKSDDNAARIALRSQP